ncbi:MAG TPA: GYD domain-containing protein [Xanthobacteraceae bacterium]|nr:GYD domain-containing protein [Xanthobacteraceae bacterium]
MATYVMLGKYSPEGVRGISAKRTSDARALIKEKGGDLKAAYALLGEDDLLIVAELPDTARAMQTSAALTKLLGVHFTTCPAVTAEEFDRLMGS